MHKTTWCVLIIAIICTCFPLNIHAFHTNGFHRYLLAHKGSRELQGRNTVKLLPQKTSSTVVMMAGAPAEFNWKTTKKALEDKMSKCIESTQNQFNTVRVGGANPMMLDRVMVDYYGTPTPLSQVARVSANGAQQLIVDPFEKALTKEIEKAISTADLNLTPNNDGNVIRVNIPPLTEERRKDLAKQAKAMAEDGKVALRNVRRDFVDKIKQAEKDKVLGKDESKTYQDDAQKITDTFVKKVDDMLKTKEKDLLKI